MLILNKNPLKLWCDFYEFMIYQRINYGREEVEGAEFCVNLLLNIRKRGNEVSENFSLIFHTLNPFRLFIDKPIRNNLNKIDTKTIHEHQLKFHKKYLKTL